VAKTNKYNIVETNDIKRAVALVNTVLESNDRIGRIIGASGSGKTTISEYLAANMDVIRITPWAGISRKGILQLVAQPLGISQHLSLDALMFQLREFLQTEQIIIVIDECNHLNWKHLEILRYLPDECNAALILSGTPLFEQLFNVGRSHVYLQQLKGRIGTKEIHLEPLRAKDVAAYVMQPRMEPQKVTQPLAKEFYRYTDKGNFRIATDLMGACERVMTTNQKAELTKEVIQAAAATLDLN
jgi:DNA transposition AAA+ family ATPase